MDILKEKRTEVSKMTYGYIRVSSRDQNEGRQIIAMHEFGIEDKQIYLDKQSGKDFVRPQYRKLMRKLKSDDTLVVKSIDRLGRNYDEILVQWRAITKQKKAAIVVLDMPLLDTRQSRDLTGTLIADIVLQLLSYVAQTEREFIKQRQKEGIAAAKARGVQFGRAPMERPAEYSTLRTMWLQGEISAREAGRQNKIWMGCSIHSGDREFRVPDDYPLEAAGSRVDCEGRKYIRVKGVRWYTNMDYVERHTDLELWRSYSNEKYPPPHGALHPQSDSQSHRL